MGQAASPCPPAASTRRLRITRVITIAFPSATYACSPLQETGSTLPVLKHSTASRGSTHPPAQNSLSCHQLLPRLVQTLSTLLLRCPPGSPLPFPDSPPFFPIPSSLKTSTFAIFPLFWVRLHWKRRQDHQCLQDNSSRFARAVPDRICGKKLQGHCF